MRILASLTGQVGPHKEAPVPAIARAQARAQERRDVADIRELLRTEKTKRSSVELSNEVWERLEEIAGSTYKTASKRYTRDEVMESLLRWAIEEWDAKRKR